jgi:hypothetical protein
MTGFRKTGIWRMNPHGRLNMAIEAGADDELKQEVRICHCLYVTNAVVLRTPLWVEISVETAEIILAYLQRRGDK